MGPASVRVLTIDDEPMIRKTIAGHLSDMGYEVMEAGNGREGLELYREARPDAVLVDLRMPEVDGMDVLRAVSADDGETPIIVVSGTGVMADVVEALRAGAWDFVTKPIEDMGVLEYALTRALERSRLLRENRLHHQELERKVQRRTEELEHSNVRLVQTLDETVNALAKITEKRDPYTYGHQARVAGLAEAMARQMGLGADQVQGVRIAAILHDIGKISVPAEILVKPTVLEPQEMELMKIHPAAAWDILKDVPFRWPIAEICLQHHERMDGSGYPRGLIGDEILLEARILAVADTVEAMSSHRPYRPRLGIRRARVVIEEGDGTLYDPGCAAAFYSLVDAEHETVRLLRRTS